MTSEHVKSRSICMAKFYLFVIQMVCYSDHGTGHLNSKPVDERTSPQDLNTKLVCYSDPHCSLANRQNAVEDKMLFKHTHSHANFKI